MHYACTNRTCENYLVEREVEEPIDADGNLLNPQGLATYDHRRVCSNCQYPMARFPEGLSGPPEYPAPDTPPPSEIPPPPTQAEINADLLNALRGRRDALLAACDWTQTGDVQSGMNAATRRAWADYRQALRDYPSTVTDPTQPPAFPSQPAASVINKQELTLAERLLLQASNALAAAPDFPTAQATLTQMGKQITSGTAG